MTRSKKAVLTNLELQVMRVVWDTGDEAVTVREVAARMNLVRSRALAYNTVQTMLTILKDKGMVVATPGPGRAHVYRAKRSQEEVTTSMVGDLVERLFDGQVSPLLVNLVEHEDLSREELERIREVLDERLEDREDTP